MWKSPHNFMEQPELGLKSKDSRADTKPKQNVTGYSLYYILIIIMSLTKVLQLKYFNFFSFESGLINNVQPSCQPALFKANHVKYKTHLIEEGR